MGPLLFVWAVPTVILFAGAIAVYKTTGLVDRMSLALHPLVRPFGLNGRDVTRVLMGYGCNVPAVISTRSCSSCTRPTAAAAIAFGSACSYQLGATMSVFGAAGSPWLVWPYLGFLVLSTLVYLRLTAPAAARSPLNVPVVEGRSFLTRPNWKDVWEDAGTVVLEFFQKAMPIFVLISLAAALVVWSGAMDVVADALGPAFGAVGLPGEAALPTVLSALRKDGILLFGETAGLSAGDLLVAVYLAGVLLPCLVTLLTVGREFSVRFALGLAGRQLVFATAFTLALAAAVRAAEWV
ncbi:MAG: nucleoside recognition domain-containing protein [Dehalococcoidia bacterium]